MSTPHHLPESGRTSPRLPSAFTTPGVPSFTEFLAAAAPDLLPGRGGPLPGAVENPVRATTILALRYADGVLMAGDRRATMGNLIAQNDIEKVFPADAYSAIGIAGTAGVATELVRLYQVELEHYEKIEGSPLSLDGKANRLASMIRGNLAMALQGLAVLPLFAGYDTAAATGRIFSFDLTGGRYEERGYHAVGSGAMFAQGSLKKTYRAALPEADAVRVSVEALIDAADDDSATGGPDLSRKVFPVVACVTAAGYRRIADDELARITESILAERSTAAAG